jgi:hypothetical protein
MRAALAWEGFVLHKAAPGLKTFGQYAKVSCIAHHFSVSLVAKISNKALLLLLFSLTHTLPLTPSDCRLS